MTFRCSAKAAFIRMLSLIFLTISGQLLISAPVYAQSRPIAAIVYDATQTEPNSTDLALQKTIQSAGYSTQFVSAARLADPGFLHDPQLKLIVLVRSDRLPADAALQTYLQRGGDLIALHTPAWQVPLVNNNGHWMSRADYERANADTPPDHLLFDFSTGSLAGWTRTTNDLSSPTTDTLVPSGLAPNLNALTVEISNLTGWDTFMSPPLAHPFPPGDIITSFAAKGDDRTSVLAIEWDEKDGSRWIATVPLKTYWRHYNLSPSAFHFWSSGSPSDRGGPGDSFHPHNAARISFGLAFTHTGTVGGAHRFWVADVGTSAVSTHPSTSANVTMPPVDGLYPSYKFFNITGPAVLHLSSDQPFLHAGSFAPTTDLFSVQPRPRGVGIDKGRDWRWIPLITAKTTHGEWRGNPAALTFWTVGDYRGAAVASFCVGDPAFYRQPTTLHLIHNLAAALRRGMFMTEAGANAFTYFLHQPVKLGATISDMGSARSATLELAVAALNSAKPVLVKRWRLQLPAGNLVSREFTWQPTQWPAGGYRVTVKLYDQYRMVDIIHHNIHIWLPPKHPHFVTTRNGEFIWRGKPWRINGVNYMPSSGIGQDDGNIFEHWMGREAYDPKVIQRDLEHVKHMGLNEVSAFIYHLNISSHNLLDFLRRCRKLGIKVNLSLRSDGSTPMNFRWPQTRAIIKAYRLWENDTVFAYDLAWEPSFGDQQSRRQWDGDWRRWVIERYGSVASAEKNWGYPIPRINGAVTNPSGAQLTTEGAWKVMVAAYRHFLDDLLYKKYSAAARLVRSVDPHHLVSFRMAETGDPTYNWDQSLPYDFPGLAGAVDFLAPEGYGRIGNWKKVKPGVFEVAYARACAPNKPVIWAENGMSVWNIGLMKDDPAELQQQARYYHDFYRLLRMTHCNGIIWWWYPGGFRVGENSDFGVINPDGTARPVTNVIREEAKPFLNVGPPTPYKSWITINRDAYATGIYGVYNAVKSRFWKLEDEGENPGLRFTSAKNSADVPLIAIGDVPYDGHNPPKLLDSAFDQVTTVINHHTLTIGNRTDITAPAGKRLVLMVQVRNLSPVTWLAGRAGRASVGDVILIAKSGKTTAIGRLAANVPPLAAAPFKLSIEAPAAGDSVPVILRCDDYGRARFGDVFKFNIAGK